MVHGFYSAKTGTHNRWIHPCPGEFSWYWASRHKLPPSTHSAGGTSVSQGYFISEHAPNEELKKKNEEPKWAWMIGSVFWGADEHLALPASLFFLPGYKNLTRTHDPASIRLLDHGFPLCNGHRPPWSLTGVPWEGNGSPIRWCPPRYKLVKLVYKLH